MPVITRLTFLIGEVSTYQTCASDGVTTYNVVQDRYLTQPYQKGVSDLVSTYPLGTGTSTSYQPVAICLVSVSAYQSGASD